MRIGPIRIGGKPTIIGKADDPMMIRYYVIRFPWVGVFIHRWFRSDHDKALHDHPWPFVSIILWGWYWEHNVHFVIRRRWLSFAYRPAEYRHRVELPNNKPIWTLMIVGQRSRNWGFWPSGKWCWWRQYNTNSGICEEEVIHHGGKD